jgi:type IV secretion system protein VirD4
LRRSPGQNAMITFFVMIVCFAGFGVLPTQWFAAHYDYDPNLGEALIRGLGIALYAPTDWLGWGLRLADVKQLQKSVHIMLTLGLFSGLLALLFAIMVNGWLSKERSGMTGLHGTARFAEIADVNKTGFVDDGAYKARGVVIGSVMIGRRGEVIHPNHKNFEERYRPVFEKRTWKKPFSKIPKRDRNKRPMYAPREAVVKRIKLLRDDGNTHIFAFCPTRSGKGTGMVIPTLLTWLHSVFVNDPKGEAYALSAGFRKAAGQAVIKFEPACTDGTGACWNPLDEIRIFTEYDVSDAQTIMSMACDPEGKGLNDYFDKAGYEFLTALALHVRYEGNDGSLAGAARYLGDPVWDSDTQMYADMQNGCHDPDFVNGWIDTAGKPTQTHPMIANSASTMLKKEDKDRSGVLSTAKSLLSLYLDPIVARNTGTSDFLVRDLMTGEKPVSLYYVVAPTDMERLTPLTRLFYALFIRRNAAEIKFEDGQSVRSYTHPLLMIIDEAASLRKLPILQEALGYIAGYGIRLFMLVQDIAQVVELYGEHQSFESGAEVRIVYAPNKEETAAKLAKMAGTTTITVESVSVSRESTGLKGGSVSVSSNQTARDLMTSNELMVMHDQDMLVFIKGQPVVYGRKAYYYENEVMVGRASMKPPVQSERLRDPVVPKARSMNAVVGEPESEESEEEEKPIVAAWVAARTQMAAAIGDVGGTSVGVDAEELSDSGDSGETVVAVSVPVRRSRYAVDEVGVSDDDKALIATIVQDVALVDKISRIEAF